MENSCPATLGRSRSSWLPTPRPAGKHLAWNEVDRFCHRTSPWDLLHEQDSLISFDEHTIPRWTKKFSIPKGYVTTRNKYMRCEKLYYGYDLRLADTTTVLKNETEAEAVRTIVCRQVISGPKKYRITA